MDGDTVILDWAKCCDCEAAQVKPKGQPCEVAITTAHTLKLKYDNSQWRHNIIEIGSKADFDVCEIPNSTMAMGQTEEAAGVQSMDHSMEFKEAGTYYYVCSVMCLESTGGPHSQYCHCKGFMHKLIVTVTQASVSTETSLAHTRSPPAILASLIMGLALGLGSLI
mmetsp:Transcript_17321/g.30823  ORF Transcript_17321/g.30823 Transcript_17321/m.30823 type:complete len:166 (+) Transcript_17321:161-658(+)